jgi:integrase
MERMRRRRFQNPKPKVRGNWWELRVWKEEYVDGRLVRKRAYIKLAAADKGERQVLKLAAAELNKLNLGLLDNAAIPFENFVEEYYTPNEMPLLAASSRGRTEGVLRNYLVPMFGRCSLHEMTYGLLQRYFSDMKTSKLSHESRDKIRDVLSSVLGASVRQGILPKNPMESVRMPADRRGKRTHKPHLSPQEFSQLIETIQEPYATMVYVAIYTGLRVSELIGLRWEDIHEDSITVDERCCRGEWGAPKSESSNATIGVNPTVIERLHKLKYMTVQGRCGNSVRKYKVVKKDGPLDLVFQSLRTGASMRDNNILSRHIKPVARALGLGFVNWRCLRTSHATWLKLAGADVKDAQAQMRHSRASTTLDIYQQFVPESQKKVVARLDSLTRTIQ